MRDDEVGEGGLLLRTEVVEGDVALSSSQPRGSSATAIAPAFFASAAKSTLRSSGAAVRATEASTMQHS